MKNDSLEEKNSLIKTILNLFEDKGVEVLSDETTFLALINDLLPGHQKEVFLLQCMSRKTSFQKLWDSWNEDQASFILNISLLKKDLQDSFSLDSQAIDWLIELWNQVFLEHKQKEEEKSQTNLTIQEAHNKLNSDNTENQQKILENEILVIQLHEENDELKEQISQKNKEITILQENNKILHNSVQNMKFDLIDQEKEIDKIKKAKDDLYHKIRDWIIYIIFILFICLLIFLSIKSNYGSSTLFQTFS